VGAGTRRGLWPLRGVGRAQLAASRAALRDHTAEARQGFAGHDGGDAANIALPCRLMEPVPGGAGEMPT
jgi:hypothetical protein